MENENEMLLTFGFDLSVIHFQTVICTASDPNVINKNIQRNAYVIAGDLIRLTTICLQYSPNFAACICIQLASTLLNLPVVLFDSLDPFKAILNYCSDKCHQLVSDNRLGVDAFGGRERGP